MAGQSDTDVMTDEDLPKALIISGDNPKDSLFIACTIDGKLYAVNKETGHVLWKCDDIGGPLIRGSSLINEAYSSDEKWALDHEMNFLIEPNFPGSLYIYVPGDILQV